MRQRAWQRRTEWPLTAVSLLFLIAYSIEVLLDLRGPLESVCETVINFTWLLFATDYVVNLALADRRWRWFYTHVLDLAVIALPILRPLRLLRLMTLLKVLQRATGAAVRGRVIMFVSGATVLLAYSASLAILDAEQNAPGTKIADFGTAVWWTFSTMTTVGYGDVYPTTPIGRVIAVGVMVGGIALLGVVTATLASWIVQRVAQADEASQAATRGEIRELRDEIAGLRDEFFRRPASDAGPHNET